MVIASDSLLRKESGSVIIDLFVIESEQPAAFLA
jgi:hypothetical protein